MSVQIRLKTPIPRHSEQLQISKDARVIEEELNTKLITLVSQIQKLTRSDSNSVNILYDANYKEKIDSIIRRGIEQIYRIASEYSAKFTGREQFTTRIDLETITRLTGTYINILYGRIQRFIIFADNQEKVKVKPEFIVKFTTANMTQATMREAIISKARQILNPVTITTAALDDQTDENAAILDEIINPVVYVWVTSQDDKVCPICSSYEGQAWPADSTDQIPSIPDDTHPNCRCIIQLAEAEFM